MLPGILFELLEEYYRLRRNHYNLLYEDWEELERNIESNNNCRWSKISSVPNLTSEIKLPRKQGPTICEVVDKEWDKTRKRAMLFTYDLWSEKK
jgi:predicted nuclease with TOPRIM domain